MNISPRDLNAQLFRITRAGWIPFFTHAATASNFSSALLVAIGSRETNLRSIKGDGGHGFGVMQIDIRSFRDYCSKWVPEEVEQNIRFGAEVLSNKMSQVHDRATRKFPTADDALHVAVAAYNTGVNAVNSWNAGRDPDEYTTGHDYGRDVMERAAWLRANSKGVLA